MLANFHRVQIFQRILPIRSVYQVSVLNPQILQQRHLSTDINSDNRIRHNDPRTIDQEEILWRRVFHFHEMKNFAAMTKLKFYPLIIGVAMVPISAGLQFMDIVPEISLIPPLLMGKLFSFILNFVFDQFCI